MKTQILLLLFIANVVVAQGNSTGSSHLKIPASARVAAMGEALTADPGNLASSLINPANIALSRGPGVLLGHTEWIQDVRSELLAASLPLFNGQLGLAVGNTNIGGIEVREVPGPPVATFTARSASIQVLYGTNVSKDLSVGTTMRYLYEKIYVDESSGYSVDVGALYKISNDGPFFGLAFTNLGAMDQFRSESSDLPSQLEFGGSYFIPENEFEVLLSASFVREFQNPQNRLNIGSEVSYQKTFALRLGYQTGFESRNVTAGVGFHYSFATLDYGYIPFSHGLGNVHLFSIGFVL